MDDSSLHIQCVLKQAINYEDASHSDINTAHLRTELYPHQVRMVKAMRRHKSRMTNGFIHEGEYITGKLGIVADPPGGGKTLSVLAYLGLKEEGLTRYPIFGELNTTSNRYFSSHERILTDVSFINVVIVPQTHLYQWQQQIQQHTRLKAFTVSNRRILRNNSTYRMMCESNFILTTNRVWHDLYAYTQQNGLAWKNLFIDEATHIYFNQNDGIPTFEFVWLITANWLSLQFRNQHLTTNQLYDISNNHTFYCSTESNSFYRQLIPWTHPFRYLLVLRNDENTLYPYPEIQRSEIVCRQQYTLLNMPPSILGTNYDGLKHERMPSILAALGVKSFTLDKMKELYERPELIESKKDDDCTICLEPPQNTVMLPCCITTLCGACILRQLIMQGQCPACRAPIALSSLHLISSSQDVSANSIVPMTKQDTCIQYIQQHSDCNDNAFLVYTIFENTYFQLYTKFVELGITSDYLELNSHRTSKSIANFNNGNTKVLFISNIDSVRGFNLKATHLILFYAIPSYEREQTLIYSMRRLGSKGLKQVVQLTTALD
jgi:SNF2-related domain/Zinc finger, C3HC4 type (RING finger)